MNKSIEARSNSQVRAPAGSGGVRAGQTPAAAATPTASLPNPGAAPASASTQLQLPGRFLSSAMLGSPLGLASFTLALASAIAGL